MRFATWEAEGTVHAGVVSGSGPALDGGGASGCGRALPNVGPHPYSLRQGRRSNDLTFAGTVQVRTVAGHGLCSSGRRPTSRRTYCPFVRTRRPIRW